MYVSGASFEIMGFVSEAAQETRSSISIQDNVYVSGASFGIMGFVSETAQETRSSMSIQDNANVFRAYFVLLMESALIGDLIANLIRFGMARNVSVFKGSL